MMFHDSRNIEFRDPIGAIPENTEVILSVNIPDELSDGRIFLCLQGDTVNGYVSAEKQMFKNNETGKFSISLNIFKVPGVYFYHFKAEKNGVKFYGNNKDSFGGVGSEYDFSPIPYQITVYKKDLAVPKWFLDSIIYQIFPDRFNKGIIPKDNGCTRNKPERPYFIYGSWKDLPMYITDKDNNVIRWDFFGGNLPGVEEKIDYIKNVGANIIYLNPIFESTSNHRYDTGDYMNVDSLLGGNNSLKSLVDAGKMKHVRIILDGAFSHTGEDSIYFDKYNRYDKNGAYNNTDSPYKKWYNFKECNEYECWWGVKSMPNVNETEPSYIKYNQEVIKHWMSFGISGWRLDVADELPDMFIKKLRETADNFTTGDQPVIIGEVWEDASNKISYGERRMYFTEKELHSVTNYTFRDCILNFLSYKESSKNISRRFLSLYENNPKHNFYALVNMTGTHDVIRLMTYMLSITKKDKKQAIDLMKIYSAVLFTFPGVPMIYYGDETCLEGEKDPDNRRTYPWGNENQEMIEFFSDLTKLRRDNAVLRTGFWRILENEDSFNDDIFMYERYFVNGFDAFWQSVDEKTKSIICIINRKLNEKEIIISGLISNTKYYDFVTGERIICSDGIINFKTRNQFMILISEE